MSRTLLIGCGNRLKRDDAVGVLAAETLKDIVSDRQKQIEVIIAETTLLPFIKDISQADKVVFLDAVEAGARPGTIVRCNLLAQNQQVTKPWSQHQMSINEVLAHVVSMGSGPKQAILFGIQYESIGWGLGVSPAVEEALPRLVKLVTKEVQGDSYGQAL